MAGAPELRDALPAQRAHPALPAAGRAPREAAGSSVRRPSSAGNVRFRGLLTPGDFIPLAERTGLIAPISEWVVEEACRQGRVWHDAGLDLYVSVNLPAAFWEPTAMRHVLDTIESFGLSPDRMMIEITESTASREGLGDAPILAELHERGLRLAIDDFGTGIPASIA